MTIHVYFFKEVVFYRLQFYFGDVFVNIRPSLMIVERNLTIINRLQHFGEFGLDELGCYCHGNIRCFNVNMMSS